MITYDLIFEALQEAVNSGDITEEFAEEVNDIAYEKYVEEKTALNKYYDKKIKPLKDKKEEYSIKRNRVFKRLLSDFYKNKEDEMKLELDKNPLARYANQKNFMKNQGKIHGEYNGVSNRILKDEMNRQFGTDYGETKHYIAKSGYKNSYSGPLFKK